MSPENEEASKVDAQMQRRALPQITDVTGISTFLSFSLSFDPK